MVAVFPEVCFFCGGGKAVWFLSLGLGPAGLWFLLALRVFPCIHHTLWLTLTELASLVSPDCLQGCGSFLAGMVWINPILPPEGELWLKCGNLSTSETLQCVITWDLHLMLLFKGFGVKFISEEKVYKNNLMLLQK